jgi:hypothetical protein
MHDQLAMSLHEAPSNMQRTRASERPLVSLYDVPQENSAVILAAFTITSGVFQRLGLRWRSFDERLKLSGKRAPNDLLYRVALFFEPLPKLSDRGTFAGLRELKRSLQCRDVVVHNAKHIGIRRRLRSVRLMSEDKLVT